MSAPPVAGSATLAPLARLAAATDHDALPEAVRHKASIHLLDTLGAGLAGAGSAETAAMLAALRHERGTVPVWGTPVALGPRDAALVNGVSSHAFELDDTGGCDHSGAVVVPAALAAVASVDAPVTGRRLLTAVVVGYDVARRVLEALGGYEAHNGAGFHSTGTCGPLGAAAAAAHVLGLTVEQTQHAVGLAASAASGVWAFVHDGAMSKRLHAGQAAEAGVRAALLARAGMTGPSAVLDDVWGGLLSTYARDTARPEALVDGLGVSWRIERCSIKPYASCRGTHSAIDAVAAILDEHRLSAADVASVSVRLSEFLQGMCGGRDVGTLAAAQLSLPYAVAARVELGGAGLDAYQEHVLLSAAMARRMATVNLVVDPRQSATDEPLVSVRTTDGMVHTRQAGPPLGSPSNPLSDTAIRAKFRSLATRSIPRDQAQHIERIVLALDEVSDVRVVTALLAR
ncbi:MmgE/PrpD family protein [Micromonospora sp. DR5-3]|uniref:MmgE/PrpD family protein n=1 Tax=unclassified Micromonospora TaxID=2617518 RepID=UPI0011D6A04D|nr:MULTISPECIES: MmgE/PrpD family protein [unclassified Micromonospora]MCW3818969.1 MmgE/PrpD family protein [Micromonospora sp. DR5-3]TYC19646.1 MmgE/PrpD family protein [Micromonospora sp. MP36]